MATGSVKMKIIIFLEKAMMSATYPERNTYLNGQMGQ
jgi:hypothetical protein